MECAVSGRLALIHPSSVCWRDGERHDVIIKEKCLVLIADSEIERGIEVARVIHPLYGVIKCLMMELKLVDN
jgi:hypothetical protein